MNIFTYSTELIHNNVSNFVNVIPDNNESNLSAYDHHYDNTGISMNNTMEYSGGLQHLSIIFQQFFSKISDNHSTYDASSSLSSAWPGILVPPSSAMNGASSYRFLSFISLWFVLIFNPILVKHSFGVSFI